MGSGHTKHTTVTPETRVCIPESCLDICLVQVEFCCSAVGTGLQTGLVQDFAPQIKEQPCCELVLKIFALTYFVCHI